MASFTFILGFLLGFVAVLIAEGLALYIAIVWLSRKRVVPPKPSPESSGLDSEQWLASACNKKGMIWFLEPESVPTIGLSESQTRGPKELKLKRNIVQVHPVRKYAKIKDRLLILYDLDGSEATIKLLNCTILAVSSSNLSLKKWAKKYPIMLESKSSVLYGGSKTCYLYFDSAWEKESWCKALRLASSNDNKLINWYAQLNKEFNNYLASFSAEFPSFLKPSALHGEIVEKTIRVDGLSSYSKARIFLKKFTKKASKSGVESRTNSISSLPHEVRKSNEKVVTPFDVTAVDGFLKGGLEDKCSTNFHQDLAPSGSKGLYPIMPDAISDDKYSGDDGTLCCNLLLSRFFFDGKRSAEVNSFVKNRIQKTLSNMRTPSYIGELTCVNLDLGNLPPYIHKIRVLPMDLTEVWAVEVDIEYLGGLLVDIETRFEVCEPEQQDDFINASSETNFNGEATSLLEGFEYYSSQINSSSNLVDQNERREGEADCLQQPKISVQASVNKSKWKTILHSIAEQVSQVPLSLAIRIPSLRGTLRFHIRPPPSDQLWFGFTAMPDIDWHLETSVGERKITSSQIALLMGNRFKAAVRDSLVLPNCESISIPWMLAEKDDWLPRRAAPFVRASQEASDTVMPGGGADLAPTVCPAASPDDNKAESARDAVHALDDHPPPTKPTAHSRSSSRSSGSAKELAAPLLPQESSGHSRADSFGSAGLEEHQSLPPYEEDAKINKRASGRRERMREFGKKMGEKLEEKRRHIEEKSRHIVEKMIENSKS